MQGNCQYQSNSNNKKVSNERKGSIAIKSYDCGRSYKKTVLTSTAETTAIAPRDAQLKRSSEYVFVDLLLLRIKMVNM